MIVSLRINPKTAELIDEIVKENPDLFLNRSHLIRRGLVLALREYNKIPQEAILTPQNLMVACKSCGCPVSTKDIIGSYRDGICPECNKKD